MIGPENRVRNVAFYGSGFLVEQVEPLPSLSTSHERVWTVFESSRALGEARPTIEGALGYVLAREEVLGTMRVILWTRAGP